MNKKFLFILPIILLTSCSDLTNNTSKFNLLDENKFYKVILYEDFILQQELNILLEIVFILFICCLVK